MIHNGSSIWTKPAVVSLNQAVCTVLGVSISSQLTRCGPVEIFTPGTTETNQLVTEMELYVPQLPLDTKLMTSSSNKSCTILVNRRRVQIREFEKVQGTKSFLTDLITIYCDVIIFYLSLDVTAIHLGSS